jgi:predicted Zn-dependent protease
MDSSKRSGLIWIAGALGCALCLAVGFNVLVDLIPPSLEVRLARKFPTLDECQSKEGRAALEKIRSRLLLPGDDVYQIRLQVVKSAEVNAYAFLGGAIFINSGLLHEAFNADEVAGVIAHEMSHVRNRDVLQGLSGQLLIALLFAQVGDSTTLTKLFTHAANLKYTRSQEERADQGAILRLQSAHISTQALANFFKRLPSFGGLANAVLSDHPDSNARSQMFSSVHVSKPTPALEDSDWQALKTMCLEK